MVAYKAMVIKTIKVIFFEIFTFLIWQKNIKNNPRVIKLLTSNNSRFDVKTNWSNRSVTIFSRPNRGNMRYFLSFEIASLL